MSSCLGGAKHFFSHTFLLSKCSPLPCSACSRHPTKPLGCERTRSPTLEPPPQRRTSRRPSCRNASTKSEDSRVRIIAAVNHRLFFGIYDIVIDPCRWWFVLSQTVRSHRTCSVLAEEANLLLALLLQHSKMAMIVVGSCCKEKGQALSFTDKIKQTTKKSIWTKLLSFRSSGVPDIYDASIHTTRARLKAGGLTLQGILSLFLCNVRLCKGVYHSKNSIAPHVSRDKLTWGLELRPFLQQVYTRAKVYDPNDRTTGRWIRGQQG